MTKKLKLALSLLLIIAFINISEVTDTYATEVPASTETTQSTETTSTDNPTVTTETTTTDSNTQTPVDISGFSAVFSDGITSYVFSSEAICPAVTVSNNGQALSLSSDGVTGDYTVSYKNNVKPGTATVTVSGIGAYTGNLTLNFDITLAKPVLTTAITGKNVALSWEKVAGAKGYIIERKVKGGEFSVLKKITKGSKVSFTDKKVTENVTYVYRISAYYKKASTSVTSEVSDNSKIKIKPAAVTITNVLPLSNTSMEVTWTLQDKADGYIIYRKEKGGSFKKIKVLKAYGTNHYTDSKVSYGKTYTYTVCAYWKNGDKKIVGTKDQTGYKEKLYWTSSYEDGYLIYRDKDGDMLTNVEGIIGAQSSYEIKINKKLNTVTIYAKDPATNAYTIPVKAFACSTGSATPLGVYYAPAKIRWQLLSHDVYGQWCTRITPLSGHILFHSVWYYQQDKLTLSSTEFNKLGTAASAGCCRLNCRDVKWIYDNCAVGTKITIYNDSENPGPLGKPDHIIIEKSHTWDPTDPTCTDLCKEKGCHDEYAK